MCHHQQVSLVGSDQWAGPSHFDNFNKDHDWGGPSENPTVRAVPSSGATAPTFEEWAHGHSAAVSPRNGPDQGTADDVKTPPCFDEGRRRVRRIGGTAR